MSKIFSEKDLKKLDNVRSKGNEEKTTLRKAANEYHNRIIENNPAAEAYNFSGAFEIGAEWALDRVKSYIENHVRLVEWLSSPYSSAVKPMYGEEFIEKFINDIKNGESNYVEKY